MRTGWLILTAILFIIGSLMLPSIIYWMIIGPYPYGVIGLASDFATMLGLYVLSYLTWKRAKKPSQDTKNKSQ
jgi:membrane protein implicated in regulation of membrane protease activity